MEGDVEALPMNESSVSDIEMTVDLSIPCGLMVDWGLFLLAARWSAAFLSASPASVVAASRSCGSAFLCRCFALEPVFSHVFGSFVNGLMLQTLRVCGAPLGQWQQRQCTCSTT